METSQTKQLIDDLFYVTRTSFGTFRSYDKDDKELVTSSTEENCVNATRFYCKGLQEGFDFFETSTYSGKVDGKL